MISLGIDPSATATGVVILTNDDDKKPVVLKDFVIKPEKRLGMDRVTHIATRVMETIHFYKPDRIVIEGYSLNMKNASSVVPLVEIGGALRLMMYLDDLTWFDPRATEVKKFVSGSGNSNKDQVMMQVYKRWGYEAPDNNLADAYVLACMGLGHAGKLSGMTKDMLSVLANLPLRKQ